jgi:phage terminase Nu1 subunit (DNA packaging protein)
VTTHELERYVDARELAELMGVSVRTIMRWVAAGAPSETWGMTRTRRFLPSEVIAWAQRRRTLDNDNPLARRSNVVEHEPKR